MKNVTILSILILFAAAASTQNVGIGTTTPAAMLDVNSTVNVTARFNGSNQMYVGLFESNTQRGYLGSFSGATEDFDLGTSSNNTNGKLHFTIKAIPKMSIDIAGNVGIGTITPVEKLDISGSIKMTGELKPNGIAGAAGQVLTSNGNGTMQWSSLINTTSSSGNGGWGDCSIYNINSYDQAANTNGQVNDYFGFSVSMSGDYAIAGAGGDSEIGLSNIGSATIFKYNNTSGAWENQGKILNPTPAVGDGFGYVVSVSGDYAIAGALYDDENGFTNNGSATIFKRNIGTGVWESQGKLINNNPENDNRFGVAVAISGDYAIVGAYYDTEGGFFASGSASIFKRNIGTGVWESQGKLNNANPVAYDCFGSSVSISGDYAIVGAMFDDENNVVDGGSATIFKRNAATGVWESQGKIIPNGVSTSAHFGQSVSINGDYAAIGAPSDTESNAEEGSVSIYKRNTVTGIWELMDKLYNPQTTSGDNFGTSVSITDNYLLVGAVNDTENEINGSGSATIFKRVENIWRPHQKFCYPMPTVNSDFGNSVCIDNTTNKFICGAPRHASSKGMVFFGKVK